MLVIRIILIIYLFGHAIETNAGNYRRIQNLRGNWKFNIGDNLDWANPDYDDSSWEEIYVPSAWEEEGFNGYDGFAWYRTSFKGSIIKNESHVYIKLGYIDDVDEVYVNGNLIGYRGDFPPNFNTAYSTERFYYIPRAYLNENGQNLIAVRVYDVIHGGGITSGNIGLYVPLFSANALVLEGIWNLQFTESDAKLPNDDWSVVMVPGFWDGSKEIKKKFHFNDFFNNNKTRYGWYQKAFYIPGRLKNKALTLVLGKIDDFDRTYINGRLVGETKDYRGFGESNSYQQLRVYPIPDGIINDNGKNIITVWVEDIGRDAGIYEGPIGIVESDFVTRFIKNF